MSKFSSYNIIKNNIISLSTCNYLRVSVLILKQLLRHSLTKYLLTSQTRNYTFADSCWQDLESTPHAPINPSSYWCTPYAWLKWGIPWKCNETIHPPSWHLWGLRLLLVRTMLNKLFANSVESQYVPNWLVLRWIVKSESLLTHTAGDWAEQQS